MKLLAVVIFSCLVACVFSLDDKGPEGENSTTTAKSFITSPKSTSPEGENSTTTAKSFITSPKSTTSSGLPDVYSTTLNSTLTEDNVTTPGSSGTPSPAGRSSDGSTIDEEEPTPTNGSSGSPSSGGSTSDGSTIDEEGTTQKNGSSGSPSQGGSTPDGSTIHEEGSTQKNETDSDTIITFTTTVDDGNSTNGTESTTTTFETSTFPITTTEDTKKNSLCFPNPCKNRGTCVETPTEPYIACDCASGFVGIRCGIVDRCVYDDEGEPCKGGFCSYTKDGRETFCDCYPGDYWDIDANECKEITTVCDANPCKNGGECNLLSGDQYQCTCPLAFSGKLCEVKERCATDGDCGHGTCRLSDDKMTRSCICDDGYYAQDEPHTCKAIKTACDMKPCKNGGVCYWFDEKTYNCTCKEGFSGKACEIVDRCSTNEDCENGVCTLSEEKKIRSCKCIDGYYPEKHTCKKISNVCQPNPCLHDGICTVLSSKEYNCTCSDGYTGKKCDMRDMCVADGGNTFCNNATCRNNYELGIYYCSCSTEEYFQYTGRKCVEADLCPLVQCEPNEECLNGKCVCKDNYKNSTGTCEPDFCSKKPCPAPGMSCEEGTGETDYKCRCEEGYTFNGTHCNEALCIFPQLNLCHQQCTMSDSGYACGCDEDFQLKDDNKTCELKGNNTCEVKVCNKGSCVLKSSEEVCICPPGYIEVEGNCTDICAAAKIAPEICPGGCEATTEGGFRCKCRGKFAHAEDKTTCVVRNMCQENEAGWKKCGERNAECLQNWNETEGFKCECRKGHVKMEDGICRDACSMESNKRMCSLKGGICEVDRDGNATCKCPPYFQLNEEDAKCNKAADVSYLITLPLDLSTYSMVNRKRRSLETPVDYKKVARDVKTTIEEMFVGYKQSSVLYCNSTPDYILCKIELQFEIQLETQLKRLRTEDICLAEEDGQKCLLPPALVLVKERISRDVIIEPTDPCEEYIKEEICGSETMCISSKSSKSFNCTCKPGFVMRTIDYSFGSKYIIESCRDIDECIKKPCLENSVCVNNIGSYACLCLPGFRKELSDSNNVKCVEICSPNPCTHGVCSMRGDHGFDCKCDAGYRGALCDLQDENFKRERNNSIILGVVLGGILLITFILFAVCVSRLRKRKCMDSSSHMLNDPIEMKERGRINNAFNRE